MAARQIARFVHAAERVSELVRTAEPGSVSNRPANESQVTAVSGLSAGQANFGSVAGCVRLIHHRFVKVQVEIVVVNPTPDAGTVTVMRSPRVAVLWDRIIVTPVTRGR